MSFRSLKLHDKQGVVTGTQNRSFSSSDFAGLFEAIVSIHSYRKIVI